MRKILFLSVLFGFASLQSNAQAYAASGQYLKNSPGGLPETWQQLLNTSNTYNNVLGTVAGKTTVLKPELLGSLTDSSTAAQTITLQTARLSYAVAAFDTLYPTPLGTNQSYISAFARVWKSTGTDTVIVTLVESIDGAPAISGQGWTAVPGVASVTVKPTSLTIPQTVDFVLNTGYFPILKSCRHYGVQFACNTGGNTGTVVVWAELKEMRFDPNSALH